MQRKLKSGAEDIKRKYDINNSQPSSYEPPGYMKTKQSKDVAPMSTSDTDTSDSCVSDRNSKFDRFQGYLSEGASVSRLPPIGVFWDIENCQIPRGMSGVAVAEAIRSKFYKSYREAEFTVVCDVTKETSAKLEDLNDAQVNLLHVNATCKNAADDKLRQVMRRFADIHGFPSAVILVTGDVNFAPDLCDLRHRQKIHTILIHNECFSENLVLSADEHYFFGDLVASLPLKGDLKSGKSLMEITINNLPRNFDIRKIRNKLRQLSDNCGGRVRYVCNGTAAILFSNWEYAVRAHKRLEGEMVFGNQISVSYPKLYRMRETPYGVQQRGSPYKGGNGNGNGNGQWEEPDLGPEAGGCGAVNTPNILTTWFQPYQLAGNVDPARRLAQDRFFQDQSAMASTWNPAQDWPPPPLPPLPFPADLAAPNPPTSNSKATMGKSGPQKKINNHRGSQASSRRSPGPKPVQEPQPKPSSRPSSTGPHPNNPTNPSNSSNSGNSSMHVDLLVTNLDQTIELSNMKKILMRIFSEHVLVHRISVHMQGDGNYTARVTLSSAKDAQYAISKLHRLKVGSKRIFISSPTPGQSANPQYIRWQVASLLKEVPEYKLPLFKFLELFEARYLNSISVSDLYRLRDVCHILDDSSTVGGRVVILRKDYRNTPSPGPGQTGGVLEALCAAHYPTAAALLDRGWAEQGVPPVVYVVVPLNTFATNLYRLMDSHHQLLPLLSLIYCYEAECGPLKQDEDSGVALEHLVTWVPGIELAVKSGIKHLRAVPTSEEKDSFGELSDSSCRTETYLKGDINQFSREVVDLLRTHPHCQILFAKFIPAFHHHFGRQLRVADYGFTKLKDLLGALPHVIQLIGEGDRKLVTLAKRVQGRRFTSDLLRILKASPNKRVELAEFPGVFEKTLGKAFKPCDYGLCSLDDLLGLLAESGLVVVGKDCIELPKKVQTKSEQAKTAQFAQEVYELLSQAPQCCIKFSKFIPAYHHHFNRQCKVSDYGFSKLIELFEAIPEVAKVEDGPEERRVTLSTERRLAVLNDQVLDLVAARFPPGLPLRSLAAAFLWKHGYTLKPEVFQANTLLEVVQKLTSVSLEADVETQDSLLVPAPAPPTLDSNTVQTFKALLDSPNGWITLTQPLSKECVTILTSFGAQLQPTKDSSDAERLVLDSRGQFAREIYKVLKSSNGSVPLNNLASQYKKVVNKNLMVAQFGCTTLTALLASFPHLVQLSGEYSRKQVSLLPAYMPPSTETCSSSEPVADSLLEQEAPESPTSTWEQELQVSLPKMTTPPSNILATSSLISPYKALLSASDVTHIQPPDPSQVPLPSGLQMVPTSHNVKRKLKLAAHFQTPLELKN